MDALHPLCWGIHRGEQKTSRISSDQLSLSHLPPLSVTARMWIQLDVICRPAEFKQMRDLHLLAPESAGAEWPCLAAACSQHGPAHALLPLEQENWDWRCREEVFYSGMRWDQPARVVLCQVPLCPQGTGRGTQSSPWSTKPAGRLFQAFPGAALLSVLSLPHKRRTEQCNYAHESAALRYENMSD